MSYSFQPITKQEINEINTGISLVCTEQKSSSASPIRKIFRAKRHGNKSNNNNMNMNHKNMKHKNMNNNLNNNMNNGLINENDKFNNMTSEQYMQYQQQSMAKRMKRKRKFDTFSSGSNMSLNEILQNANTFRVPHYAMFYVRVTKCNQMDLENENPTENEKKNENSIFHPIREECLITRSVCARREWVIAYKSFDCANNIAWKKFNPHSKIHEYQISRLHGIILLNFDKTSCDKTLLNNKENIIIIKQWVFDHGYSGFITNNEFHFYKPHLYWNLLDDNKQLKIKQTLISDMFQSTKTKPKNYSWKPTFT